MIRLRLPAIALLLLLGFSSAASDVSIATENRADIWRQTSQGWLRYGDVLEPPLEYRRPALHPAVVGALEILLTLSAMLAFSGPNVSGTLRVPIPSGTRSVPDTFG